MSTKCMRVREKKHFQLELRVYAAFSFFSTYIHIFMNMKENSQVHFAQVVCLLLSSSVLNAANSLTKKNQLYIKKKIAPIHFKKNTHAHKDSAAAVAAAAAHTITGKIFSHFHLTTTMMVACIIAVINIIVYS